MLLPVFLILRDQNFGQKPASSKDDQTTCGSGRSSECSVHSCRREDGSLPISTEDLIEEDSKKQEISIFQRGSLPAMAILTIPAQR